MSCQRSSDDLTLIRSAILLGQKKGVYKAKYEGVPEAGFSEDSAQGEFNVRKRFLA